jgi:hypothetical protein
VDIGEEMQDNVQDTFGWPVHIWSEEEILQLPDYSLWFYGLVQEKSGQILLSEIYPGIGYSDWSIYRDDGDSKPEDTTLQWASIGSDVLLRTPLQLESEFPEAEKHNWESDVQEALHQASSSEHFSLLEDFVDDRSILLKFLDARYVMDWFLDNASDAYYPDEIETCANRPELYDHIELLEKYGVLQQTTNRCYRINRKSDITTLLLKLDSKLSEMAANDAENDTKPSAC